MSYRFRPPTYQEGQFAGPLLSRYDMTRGSSVLKEGGVYKTVNYPDDARVLAAQEFYLGGHDHIVSDTTAAALTAAGYGAYLTGPL